MKNDMVRSVKYTKFDADEGVYIKHFFGEADNDRLNNLEILVLPGCQISPHVHVTSAEHFYVVSGLCEFWHEKKWVPVDKGDSFLAPANVEHGLRNPGKEVLIVYATISPPIM